MQSKWLIKWLIKYTSHVHDACFPTGLLAGLESWHCIGCDIDTNNREIIRL